MSSAARADEGLWTTLGRAARANAVPGAILWAFAASLAVSYRVFPSVAAALEPLARWQERNGWIGALLSQYFFCGLVPFVFLLTVKSIATRHPLVKCAVQATWCAASGIACWWFFDLQRALFGSGADFATLLKKTLLDQLGWTVFVIAPLNSVFFTWLGCDFSFRAAARAVGRGFFRRTYAPNLVGNWCVWFPVMAAVYSFPHPLQIQVLGAAASFWVLMCLQIGERNARRAAAETGK